LTIAAITPSIKERFFSEGIMVEILEDKLNPSLDC
jgi:hypothetical protein